MTLTQNLDLDEVNLEKACSNHPELDEAFKRFGPPSITLWSKILEAKDVYTRVRYINTKTVAVIRKLSALFKEEKEIVTSHHLRKLYAHRAYTERTDKETQSEAYFYKCILGHDPNSATNSAATYTTVGFY